MIAARPQLTVLGRSTMLRRFRSTMSPRRCAPLGVLALAACSSTGGSPAPPDASGGPCPTTPVPVASDAPGCTGTRLVVAPPITLTTPDEDPWDPQLAATPAGDRFLAVWANGGYSNTPLSGGPTITVPESIWASIVMPEEAGLPAASAVEVTANAGCPPVAAWRGPDFAVVWGDAAGLWLQTIDVSGALEGSPSLVLARPATQACPDSLLATPGGLAIGWTEGLSEGSSAYLENVGLVDATGTIEKPVLLDTLRPGASDNIELAQLGGDSYVAFVQWPEDGGDSSTALSRVDWALGTAVTQAVAPGFLGSLVTGYDALWFNTDASCGGFRLGESDAAAPVLETASFPYAGPGATLGADSCGRIVEFWAQGFTPAGFSTDFFAQPVQTGSAAVRLGSVAQSAVASAPSSLGVLWFSRIAGSPLPYEEPTTGTLSFTTLSWAR